jgi:benzodiazapine receptor
MYNVHMETSVWYQQLVRPFFAPPAWIFGPVWSVLYMLIAISVITVIVQVIRRRWPVMLLVPFCINIASNALFSPLQFVLQNNALALLDIIVVLLTIIWMMRAVYDYAPWISYLQIPYLLWVSFATVLQATITSMNVVGSQGSVLEIIAFITVGVGIGQLLRMIDSVLYPARRQSQRLNLNIGAPDRLVRLIAALALIGYAVLTSWSPILLIVGGFTLYESFFKWCGFYALIGRDTCPLR